MTVLSREDVRRQSFKEHEAIMQAITARNGDLAERLMREHIVKAGIRISNWSSDRYIGRK